MPSLKGLRQQEIVKALIRMGAVTRPGKGSHTVVTLNRHATVIPYGVVKQETLKTALKQLGVKPEEFLEHL